MSTRWLDPEEARAWRGHLSMSRLLEAAIERDLQQDSGLSLADYDVLVQLSETPSRRMRMSELATALLWSRSRLSHQIRRMERRGLVVRDECSSDARGSFACLTRAGLRAIQRAAPGHVGSIRRNLLAPLSRRQVKDLGTIADTVASPLAARLGDTDAAADR